MASPERGGGPRVSVAMGFCGAQNTIQVTLGESVESKPPAPLKGELPPQRLRGAVSIYVLSRLGRIRTIQNEHVTYSPGIL